MLNAGSLLQRVRIERPVYNASGDEILTWTTVTNTWASVEPMTGRERMQSGREITDSPVKIRMRYRENITPAMRIVHRGTTYTIESVSDIDSRLTVLELICKAVR